MLCCTNDALLSFNIVGSSTIGWWEDVSIHGDKGTALVRNGSLYVAREGESTPQLIDKADLPTDGDPDSNFVDLVLGRVLPGGRDTRGRDPPGLAEGEAHAARRSQKNRRTREASVI